MQNSSSMEVQATQGLVGSSGLGTSSGMVQAVVAWEGCIKLSSFPGLCRRNHGQLPQWKTMSMSFVDNGTTKGTMGPPRGAEAHG